MAPADAESQEILNPPGNVEVLYGYTVSQNDGVRFIDVTRTVFNGELFNLSSLYMSDRLPAGLAIDDFSARIGISPIDVYYSGPIPGQFDVIYDMHQWVIDFPGHDELYNNLLRAGHLLTVNYRIVAEDPGEIVMPFRTVCYYGLNNGYFTTSDTIFIPPLPAEIPTLGQWGIILLSISLFAVMSAAVIRKTGLTIYRSQ